MNLFSKWTSTFVVGTLIVVCVITPSAETASMRLCGQKLTRTLLAVCNNKLCGGFAADELAKRKHSFRRSTLPTFVFIHHFKFDKDTFQIKEDSFHIDLA